MLIKHVALTGNKAGQWVTCHATQQCRNEGVHISEKQFYAVQAWLNDEHERKHGKDVNRFDVIDFLALNSDVQKYWMGQATSYAKNQRGFSHTEGQDPFERNVTGSRNPYAIARFKSQKTDFVKELNNLETSADVDKEQQKKITSLKIEREKAIKAEAAMRAEKRKKAALAREEKRKNIEAGKILLAKRVAEARRQEEWRKNAGFVTFDDSYENRLEGKQTLNANHTPAVKVYVNTPESFPETIDFSEQKFAEMKSVWASSGVKARYSYIEEIKYTHRSDRSSIVRVHGLSLTSSDQYALSSQVRRTRDNTESSYSSGVMRVRMQERFYNEYIERLNSSKEANRKFDYFVADKKVEKVFLGRDVVEFDLEVYGDQTEADQSLFILSELPGGKVFSTGKKYEPKKSISFNFKDDDDTKKVFTDTQKVVSAAKGKANNLKDNMFLEKAQSSYIPEAVAAYHKVKNHSDPSVRAEGKKIFLEQMAIINSHVENIQKESDNEILNEARIHLAFLKDTTGANGSSLNLG